MSQAPRAIPPAVNGWNAAYLEDQYNQFRNAPDSVADDLRSFFQGFDLASAGGLAGLSGAGQAAPSKSAAGGDLRFALGVYALIEAYRGDGHLAAAIDPFGRVRPAPATMNLASHGLTSADLDRPVQLVALPVGLQPGATLRQVIEGLKKVYCGPLGSETRQIFIEEERQWLIGRLEAGAGTPAFTHGQRGEILRQLIKAEQFELFLQKRYPGDKRFSLEGGESLIPCLNRIIAAAADTGVEEIVIGMPHRGRLNVLINILGKTYEQVFTEFEDNWDDTWVDSGGDVKYHRGYSSIRREEGGGRREIHLALSSNPSHLESVDGVVLGRCRAKQRLRNDTTERSKVIPLLMHGDAAVIAQGAVAECLNFMNLEGYRVGGCIHVVVNNLVGFTTGPEDARSTQYCTDVAHMAGIPVFHVNGEDPEAVIVAAQLAVEYRQKFKKDVFIDLVCFRRYGHNEQDEASFTQPALYALIKEKLSVVSGYASRLVSTGEFSGEELKTFTASVFAELDKAQDRAKNDPQDPNIEPGGKRWAGFGGEYTFDPVVTAVSPAMIEEVCAALGRVPEGFSLNAKLVKLLGDRAALPKTREISYADAESLAFGTLLLEGHAVRLSGQDSRRGTFSHRHAALRDAKTEQRYLPLNSMRPLAETPDDPGNGKAKQARLCVYDSPLSESSIMAFDYGYSLADPRMLVMWEAQFGDFVNGAQVIIDQYLASAEIKWERWSGLTLLLPHGYEGAGPEHSSARLERFLQGCAQDNMQVIYPSTGPQIFHALRRQVKQAFRKPLIVMTPKSMLRVLTGTIDELTAKNASFQEIIDDPAFTAGGGKSADPAKARRVILCSGKIYHELAKRRTELKRADVAIIRIEQLYPFHSELMTKILARYTHKDRQLVWVQEEPRNAGAYTFIADLFWDQFKLRMDYWGRPAAASPACASKHAYKDQQEKIIAGAFADTIGGESRPGWSEGKKAGHTNGAAHPAAAPSEPAPPKANWKPGSSPALTKKSAKG